jgi:CubicO group peptidase (beta-lactamase class C family)
MTQGGDTAAVFSRARRGVLALAAAALFTLAAPALAFAPEDAGFDSGRLQRVDAYLDRMVTEGQVAGALVVIVRDGTVVYSDAAGFADLERKTPLQEDALFRIFSMTKPITTVAALMLVEEGKLRLSDPLSKFFPALANLRVYAGTGEAPRTEAAKREPTVHDLMRHTAGFTYGFSDNPVAATYRALGLAPGVASITPPGAGDAPMDLARMADVLAQAPLLRQPGEAFSYGVSTDLLGRIVEIVSGEPLDRFFETRIFRPLGMSDTGFTVPAEKLGRLSTFYRRDGVALSPVDSGAASIYRTRPALLSGGAGLVSSAKDYLAFLQMLLNRGEANGRRLLAPRTVDFLARNHLPPGVEVSPGIGFGLGFAVVKDSALAGTPGNDGILFWSGAIGTLFWIDPAEQLAVVFMTQITPAALGPLQRDLRALVYQAISD